MTNASTAAIIGTAISCSVESESEMELVINRIIGQLRPSYIVAMYGLDIVASYFVRIQLQMI